LVRFFIQFSCETAKILVLLFAKIDQVSVERLGRSFNGCLSLSGAVTTKKTRRRRADGPVQETQRLERERAEESRLTRANQEWAMDFIADGLVTGGWCASSAWWMPTRASAWRWKPTLASAVGRVTRVLERLIA
jgi:hypothetical protein